MAGSSWPDLIAGRTAKASDVEAKFDWLEGHIVPMTGGNQTDSVYYLGTAGARWAGVYTRSINPTSTAGGVAIGTTTAATSALLDIAGNGALLIPRVTTAQKNALTAANGMMVYDTDIALFQIYENGAWQGMGTKIGIVARAVTSTSLAATQTVLNFQGSGRLLGLSFIMTGPGTSFVEMITDSVTTGEISATTTARKVVVQSGETTTTYASTAGSFAPGDLSMNFKSQIKVNMRSDGTNPITVYALYERSS